jgi:Tfp pilus assembly protein PilF
MLERVQRRISHFAAAGLLAILIGCENAANSYARQGFVLFYGGECEQAGAAFDKSLKSDPESAEAYYGRGLANACVGQYDAAISDYSSAIKLDARWHAYGKRALAYEEKGDYIRALADFNAASDLAPQEFSIYLERAGLYARSGQVQAAKADLGRAASVEGKKSSSGYFNDYAWFLATSPAEQVRNGPLAVQYATQAADISSWQNPLILDTLAASYAENDQFDQAIKWQTKACELQHTNQPARKLEQQQMNARLALYEKHQPYREELIVAPVP